MLILQQGEYLIDSSCHGYVLVYKKWKVEKVEVPCFKAHLYMILVLGTFRDFGL